MDEKIPLQDAVSQGVIACSSCGAQGAGVKEVDGRKHFLCEACVRKSRRSRGVIAALSVAVALLLIFLILRPKGEPAATESLKYEDFLREVNSRIEERQAREALALLKPAIERGPHASELQFLAGKALMALQYDEAAAAHFDRAIRHAPKVPDGYYLMFGRALARIDRAAEAVQVLERPFESAELHERRRSLLADCYLELGRNEDVLQLYPKTGAAPEVIRIRHRAFMALGKKQEAERELEAIDTTTPAGRATRAYLHATMLREEGDFAGARAALEKPLAELPKGGDEWMRLKRSEVSIHLESGDFAKMKAVAEEFIPLAKETYVGEALWGKAMAHLNLGERKEAEEVAREFQKKVDPHLAPLRLPRLQMRHLLGETKDADLEAEAKATSKVRANDLYYFLAVATKDKAWAEKALASTPGRNFPYHSIRRLLGK